jgi:hypothetical protein
MVAAEKNPAEVGKLVQAAKMDVFEAAGWDAISIVDQKSHQAHGAASRRIRLRIAVW